MTPEEIAAQIRRELLGIEEGVENEARAAFRTVLASLDRDLREITDRIAAAQRAGQVVGESWLYRQTRLESLVAQMELQLVEMMGYVNGHLSTAQQAVVLRAANDVARMAVGVAGPAPLRARTELRARFDVLPRSQLDQFLTRSSPGTPLRALFDDIARQGALDVRNRMLAGIAQGKPVRQIAREIHAGANVSLTRARTIARTEVLGAHRAASIETMRRSPAVTRWMWIAEVGPRTCPACLAKHGTTYPTSTMLESHPNCRCTQMPMTPSWAELGFHNVPDRRPFIPSAEQAFDRLDDADRLALLGRRRLDAYQAGEITLDELVRGTRHPVWGRGIRTATLTELGV